MHETVRHEAEGHKALRLRDLVNVLFELGLTLASVASGLLRLDDREDGAVRVVEAEVGEAERA
jgi:hypothetical protein